MTTRAHLNSLESSSLSNLSLLEDIRGSISSDPALESTEKKRKNELGFGPKLPRAERKRARQRERERTNVYRDFRPDCSTEKRPDGYAHPLSLDVPLKCERKKRKKGKEVSDSVRQGWRRERAERWTNESDVETTHSRHKDLSSSVESGSESVLPDVLDVV